MEFKDIVMKRYAVKKFDGKTIEQNKLYELLEIIRYSASSFNIQPWKIKIVTDKHIKDKLLIASWNQEQITTSSHVLVFCADTNLIERKNNLENSLIKAGATKEGLKVYMDMITNTITNMSEDQKLTWAQKQVYIAASNAINGAKSLGFDSCPMEGFNALEYSKILDLPKNLIPTIVVTIGYASDSPKPKVRFSKEEVFF
jgi:nitroreductase